MIGAQVSKLALDNWMGDFYKWEGEVSQLVEGVRGKINEVTDTWSREDKDSCLKETARTFKYSGGLLRELSGGSKSGR
jgi:heme oxygenase